jgi:3-hydroxybutyryl-CoA dehydrogenase
LSEAVDGATFIIECIPEVLELKNDLFRKLDQMCSEEVILATNTSGLSPSRIALNLKHPERTLATHFWNPAHLIPLVEVLRAEFTDDKTFNRAIDMLKLMNKKPIEVKKEVPGLVGNRLQFALFREAQYLLEQGIASKEDIDAAVTYSIGRRLPVTGPLLSADMGGLDVFASISDYLFKDLSNADQSSANLKELVAQRHFGQKNGAGFYLWDEKFSEEMNHKREEQLIRFLKEDIN